MTFEPRDEEERVCSGCGALEGDWPTGGVIAKGGETFCCQACAEGTACLCNPDKIEDAIMKKAI
jgi:hypothetical protein